MNRKLTREEAIKLHKQMWTDMLNELGNEPGPFERMDFKKKWVEEHFPNEHVNSNCFLCEYAASICLGLPDTSTCYKCAYCPIAWNSDIYPWCNPGIFAVWEGNQVDYRYSPISAILALPEREVAE